MNERIYRCVVTIEDGKWLGDVPELPGAHTYAANPVDLDAAVREVIALVEDFEDGAESSLRVSYEFAWGAGPEHDRAVVEGIRREYQHLEAQREALSRLAGAALVYLTEAGGMEVAEAKTALGLQGSSLHEALMAMLDSEGYPRQRQPKIPRRDSRPQSGAA